MGWLRKVYGNHPAATNDLEIQVSKQKLLHFLYETYTKTRVDEFFNIIIGKNYKSNYQQSKLQVLFFTEFPESQPALEDLGICLQKTDLRSYLTTKLQSALETRLLHPGANTVDILITYVAAIRALRLLDPSGVLLDTVTTPVRQYLRQVS
jgi:anaphase-promoting complex subunit 2